MSMYRTSLNTAFVDQYLQARRALTATATRRGSKQAQRRGANKRAVDAVAHAIRGEKA